MLPSLLEVVGLGDQRFKVPLKFMKNVPEIYGKTGLFVSKDEGVSFIQDRYS